MSLTIDSLLPKWLQHFNVLESTNNYAMRLIDDGMAQQGLAIWADLQSKGKGQRGNTWQDHEGNIKFSLIIEPNDNITTPFQLSMIVATTIVQYLKLILPSDCQISVKWPNDIYINDKKACGLLIENVFRGAKWTHAVVGIGLNTNQTTFPEALRHKATSLSCEMHGKQFDFIEIITDLRNGLVNKIRSAHPANNHLLLSEYNQYLYKRNCPVSFCERSTDKVFEAFVLEVNTQGELLLQLPTGIQAFSFGSLEWLLFNK